MSSGISLLPVFQPSFCPSSCTGSVSLLLIKAMFSTFIYSRPFLLALCVGHVSVVVTKYLISKEELILPHGVRGFRSWSFGPVDFRPMVRHYAIVGDMTKERFSHLPIVPQTGHQVFSLWTFGGHLRSKLYYSVKDCSPTNTPSLQICCHQHTISPIYYIWKNTTNLGAHLPAEILSHFLAVLHSKISWNHFCTHLLSIVPHFPAV